MTISQRLAAEKQQAEKTAAAAATTATAKSGGKAEGEDDEEKAESDDEEETETKKAQSKKTAKSKSTKKAESEEDETEAAGEDDDEEMKASAVADPGTVAGLCAEAGVPKMAKALIDAKLPLGQVKAKIGSAAEIRAAFDAGKRVCRTIDPARAESHINAGNTVKHVKAELFDQIVKAEGPEIRNSHTAGTGGAAPQAGSYGWDKTVEKLNARHAGPASNA